MRHTVLLLVAIAVLLILFPSFTLSLFYKLDGQSGEQAVIQRFGRFTRIESEPGVHMKLPWPIETCTKVSTTRIESVQIGYSTVNERAGRYRDEAEHSICITRDQNLVDAEFVVQYQVREPDKYLFNVKDPNLAVEQVSKAVMRSVIASRSIDDILVGERAAMQDDAMRDIQKTLDDYGMGVRVVAVQYQDVHAPTPVIEAFSDVQRAREDKETAINEGKRYLNSRIPVAEGEAARTLAEAEAYHVQKVNEAKGDAARFLAVQERQKQNPTLVRRQLYLQVMEEVLPGVEKIVIDKGVGASLFLQEAAGAKGGKP
jgi:membrane protease subunit HflK